METMDPELQKNVQRTLSKLLDPKISHSVAQKHLNYLVQYISREEDLGASGTPRLAETFFLSWIKQAVDKWKLIGPASVPKNIVLFAADLTSAMCSVENNFVKLNFTGILDNFIQMLRSVPEPPNVVEVKLKYVQLILSFLTHKSGLQWIMSTNYWFDIYTMISQSAVKEIVEKCCQFVVQLLEKSQNDNEIFCYNIIDVVIAPLKDLALIYSTNSESENMTLTISLQILNKILEILFVKCCITGNFKIVDLLNNKFNLDRKLSDLIINVRNPAINFELNKTMLIILIFSASESIIKRLDPFGTKQINRRIRILNILINAACYHGTTEILELIYLLHVLISHVPPVNRGQMHTDASSTFQQQMLIFLLRPVHYFSMEVLGIQEETERDELREQLTTKILRRLVPSVREAYTKLNDSLIKFSVQDATLALRYLISCSKFYKLEAANTATQLVIYTLVDILNGLKTKSDLISKLSQEFLISLLDIITTLLENFNLSWKDSIETIYLTEITSQFLNFYLWPPQVVVKALHLLEIGISKSLSPSMALLIDQSDKDVDFGKIVYNKILDQHWQVRNAAIQVAATLTKTVKNKFEIHRKIILEIDFPGMMLNAASADPEITVKISGIRCLQEMVKIREFWNSLQKNQNLYDQILQLYYLQADGTARSEAITLFKEIYRNQLFPESVLDHVYDSLKYAVLEDQNNTVKLRGLDFWQQVIEYHLSNQGMIDGQFPDMTFSKSLKKIIKLDEKQIKKCLHHVLNDLSEIGCLTMFLFAVNHSNEELRGHATNLIKKFVDILKLYLFPSNHKCQNNNNEETSNLSDHDDIVTQQLSTNLFPISDLSPSLYDFNEDFLNIDTFTRDNSSPFSDSSSSGVSSDNSSFENDKEIQRKSFLKFVVNFEFHQKEEFLRQQTLKNDIDTIVNQILNL